MSKLDSLGIFICEACDGTRRNCAVDAGIYPDPFCVVIGWGNSSACLFGGLTVLSFGNSRMKSASPAKLSRKPMELRSDVEMSGLMDAVVVVPELEAAEGVSEHVSQSTSKIMGIGVNSTGRKGKERHQSRTCRPPLYTCPSKLRAFLAWDIIIAFYFQPRALVAGVSFPATFQRTGNCRVSPPIASTEMVSQDIAEGETVSQASSEEIRQSYLRLNVLEQNLQLYGLSPESDYADQ
jgi:hypothetical protein